MKTLNFDKQAEKFLITPAKKLKNISVIDITGHDVLYQLLRMNHIPFYFENKSQNNFCEAVPNAAVFIVVFQMHVNYLALKFN